ncbi:type IV pilus biogenesis protein PilM [Ectopseudomonas toyotomiensis]|uniref:type IV pilus biogenesis protein PilM n=1 Tax=Ectopseudomonas toyotomiensis TaxID=554344 RepID=UPI003D0DCB57
MYFHWIVFTLVIVAGGVFSQMQHQDNQTSEFASLDALSRGMLVYRSAVSAYARANPGYSGIPSDAALSLPDWYIKPAGITAYIVDGSAYTFSTKAVPGLPAALVERTESVVIGVNRAGYLVSPASGNMAILLPSTIPEGAVVAVN